MKIFKNVTSGYKKIAAGIAIVSFLALMYLAVIPGGLAYVYGPNGGVLSGAFVFIKEWPQYNATTDTNGAYTINQMPIGEYTLVGMGNDSYAPNISRINVTEGNTNFHDITLSSAKKYYIPFLYERSDNIYNAAVQIQNNGTSNASIQIDFYNTAGTLVGNDVFVVQPGGLFTKRGFDVVEGLPIFVGPAVIKSDIPFNIQGYISTVNQGVYSLAPSITEPTTQAYLPFLYQRSDQIYDSGVQVFNPGNTIANVNVILYYTNGTRAGNATYQVGPKVEASKYVFDILTGVAIFAGPAEIISDQPILVQGYVRTKASNIFSIAPSLTTTVTKAYLPFLYQRSDQIYDSGVQVYNPNTTTVANVTINMYYTNGTLAGNATYQICPKCEASKYVFDIVTGIAIFVGPAEIISDQPIVVQGYIRTKASNVFSIAPQVRKPDLAGKANVPFLFSTVNLSHDAGIQAMNPNSVNATIDIALYYPNGTKAGNQTYDVGPYVELSKYAFDIAPNIADFNGFAVITANQPIVSQGYIRKKSSNIFSIAPPVER